MTINLSKGSRIDLNKEAPGLTKVRLGLRWSPNGFATGTAWDLDVSVFGLAPNAEGQPKMLSNDYFVFYNSVTRTEDGVTAFADENPYPKKGFPASPCVGIIHKGDNRDGAAQGDDETILVDLSRLDPRVQEVSVVVTIHQAAERNQSFDQIKDSAIALYDEATGKVLANYNLESDFNGERAVQFGSLFKKDGTWRFKAIGAGFKKGLEDFLNLYQN